MGTYNFDEIHRVLTTRYNLDELKTLCARLGVPFENLEGPGLDGKARELIYWLIRRDRLKVLEPHLYGVKIIIETDPETSSAVSQISDGAQAVAHPVTAAVGSAKPSESSPAERQRAKEGDAAATIGSQTAQKGSSLPEQTGTASAYWMRLCGAIVLGLILLALLIWAFQYAPNSLPEFKQRMLAIACALVAGLFTFLLSGSLWLDGKSITTPWGGLSLSATGGIAVFVVVLIWWLSPITPISTDKPVPQPSPSPTVTGGNKTSAQIITPSAPLYTQSRINMALDDSNFEVKAGAFSQDGQLVAVGSDTGEVYLWQVKEGKLLRKLTGASERVVSVALRPDGQLIGAGYPGLSAYVECK